jgi:hypothetical protein
MTRLTKEQQRALLAVYRRGAKTNPPTYLQFRRTAHLGMGCLMVPWAGMYLGIEPDGYTHSLAQLTHFRPAFITRARKP